MKTRKELKAKLFRANEEIIQNTGDEKELLLFWGFDQLAEINVESGLDFLI